VLGVAVALVSANVITALTVFYTLITVGLFVPILGGLYIKRAGSVHAWGAIVAGVGTAAVREFAFGAGTFEGLTPAMAGLAAAILVFLVLLPVGSRPRPDRRVHGAK
jgi:SSS family solute:Na+ symporter